ncbi:hypothetical protein OAN61_00755 [bacterium]|nr:hypothetical protein [bacterium]
MMAVAACHSGVSAWADTHRASRRAEVGGEVQHDRRTYACRRQHAWARSSITCRGRPVWPFGEWCHSAAAVKNKIWILHFLILSQVSLSGPPSGPSFALPAQGVAGPTRSRAVLPLALAVAVALPLAVHRDSVSP